MLTDQTPKSEPAIACDPNAIPANQRGAWIENGRQVYASVLEVQELPDGYRLRLPVETTTLLHLAEYIGNERLCCAFLRFTLELEPDRGPFWLGLTGGAGVKAYLRSVFETNDLLSEQVAKTAGLG